MMNSIIRIHFIAFIILLFLNTNSFGSKNKWDKNKSDWSKLMKATYCKKYDKMKTLIQKGADVNYHAKSGLSALSISIRVQDSLAVSILFESGKILYDKDENLVMLASSYPNSWIVKKLIENKFPIKKIEEHNYTTLMEACSYSSKETVEYLIQQGEDVNAQHSDKMSPLMFAVGSGKPDIVSVLLKYGADKDISDSHGKKALNYLDNIPERIGVSEQKKKEIRELLK